MAKEKESYTNRLLKARSLLVVEPITDKLAREVIANLLILQEDSESKPIKVFVNSPGGSADAGFAMYDMLRYVQCPIQTICTGLCASAAVLIYLSARKERRLALPNARFLIHQPSTTVFGTVADIEISANEIVKMRRRYNEIVSAETGNAVGKVEQDADRDFWLSAEEAHAYGLVAKIITSSSEL